jgi:methyltransferase-like protein
MNYKAIKVLGIEHDWFKDLGLLENNVLGITDKHFYNKSDEAIVDIINKTTGESRKVHEE